MISQRHDIDIDQGADFELAVTYTETDGTVMDLTTNNYTATFTIKEDIADTTAVYTGTSTAGNITLGSTAPNLLLSVPYATTEGFTFDKATYDIELSSQIGENPLTKDRLIRGNVNLIKEVTSG